MSNRQEKDFEKVVHTDAVHGLYKNLGETPLACIERFKREKPEYRDVPMTYAGRLDPLAEGVLVVLSGDTVHEKENYIGLSKKYQFQILWGCETDTGDVLGLVSAGSDGCVVPGQADIEKKVKEKVGKFDQAYPAYSSRTVSGKPLFQWAREGRLGEIEIPHHEVEILSMPQFLARRTLSGQQLLEQIERKIALVSGDFRQEETGATWRKFLLQDDPKSQCDFIVDTIEISVSSGFYVRQFVSDLAHELGTRATTFHILRTQVGEYTVDNRTDL